MKKIIFYFKSLRVILIATGLLLGCIQIKAQTWNSVFKETFGPGSTDYSISSNYSISNYINTSDPSSTGCASTDVSGQFAIYSTMITGGWPGCNPVTDHSGSNGKFLDIHSAQNSGSPVVYSKNYAVCAGGVYNFRAWAIFPVLAADAGWANLNLQFKVADSGGTSIKDVSSGNIPVGQTSWAQYETGAFTVPNGVTNVTVSIRFTNAPNCAFRYCLDDIEFLKATSTPVITNPSSSEINFFPGANIFLQGKYSCSDLVSPLLYKWQKSANGSDGWTDLMTPVSYTEGTIVNYQKAASASDAGYYRLMVTNSTGSNTAASNPVKVTTAFSVKEDFGGNSDSDDPFVKGEWDGSQQKWVSTNGYSISGYNYADYTDNFNNNPSPPNVGSNTFIITKVLQTSGAPASYVIDDHTFPGVNTKGYFLETNPGDASLAGTAFYSRTIDPICPESGFSFSAWIINPVKNQETISLLFRVKDQSNATIATYETGEISSSTEWKQYGFNFETNGASSITVSIEQKGSASYNALACFDDIEIRALPVRITQPSKPEINVVEGTSTSLSGKYTCGGLTGTLYYQWQSSANGETWTAASATTGVLQPYTTPSINAVSYFRLAVSTSSTFTDENGTLFSDPVKITPVNISEPKTYWICPDNMTDYEAINVPRIKTGTGPDYGTPAVYLPGLPGEPGYLPSLIRLSMPEIDNVEYRWYNQDGVLLSDQDEYDQTVEGTTLNSVFPQLLSDNKSATFSVQNERNVNGIYPDRIYEVEPYSGATSYGKIPVYLRQSYICGSIEAKLSPVNAKRLFHESFGGKSSGDPDISSTPLPQMDPIYQQQTSLDTELKESRYIITKKGDPHDASWYEFTDHNYKLPGETHGYFVEVNADKNPGQFYSYTIDGLGECRDVNLIFSEWLASPQKWYGNEKANHRFILTNTNTGEVLAEFVSGNLVDEASLTPPAMASWRQYGFQFPIPTGINSVTLTIINNSYGTEGGNDFVMDDIEIYLYIPPVTLMPSGDSKVCPASALATLKGTYTDDGTLGQELDFRWEFSTDGGNNWSDEIPNADNTVKSVSAGVVTTDDSKLEISNFTMENNGDYRLVVGQRDAFQNTPSYNCIAVSEPRNLTLATDEEAIPPSPALSGITAICLKEKTITITNTDINQADYNSYYWTVDGVQVDNPVNSINVQLTTPGYHNVTLTADNGVGCDATAVHEYLVFPASTTWTAGGEVNNWNDEANWSNGVPGSCTNVIVPDKSTFPSAVLQPHYPVLKGADDLSPGNFVEDLNVNSYTVNQENLQKQQKYSNADDFYLRANCDTILFQMGGEAAHTEQMKYNAAKVDLDVVTNGRWFSVAPPLRDMYSGDYFVDATFDTSNKGYYRQNPKVYMSMFQVKNPQNRSDASIASWSDPFNTLDVLLSPYSGNAPDKPYQESDQPNGRSSVPSAGYGMWIVRGKYTGDLTMHFPKDSLSYNYYYYDGTIHSKVSLSQRSNRYRFIYETGNETGSVQTASTNSVPPGLDNGGVFAIPRKEQIKSNLKIVGNPFMAHLDPGIFYTVNKQSNRNAGLTNFYYLLSGLGTFDTYAYEYDQDNLIAPMQSFIIDLNDPESLDWYCYFSYDMSCTDPDTRLKSSFVQAPLKLDVLRNNVSHSNVRLFYNSLVKNDYHVSKDAPTIFPEDNKPAVIYALAGENKTSIRTIGELIQPTEIGIRTSTLGELTLRISGIEDFDPSFDIYLEDRVAKVKYNLREKPEYTFNNQTGNVEGRFFIHMVKSNLLEEKQHLGDIRIYSDNHMIGVSSPVDDPIQTVKIYSVGGDLLFEAEAVGQSVFSRNIPGMIQVVIVQVTTAREQKTGKLLLK